MPQSADHHIGARIASYRKLAGYTQRALADHSHLSLGIIRKVERGERQPTAGFLTAIARVLHVTVEDLTGQPYRSRPEDDRIHAPVAAIRTALRHWDLPGEWFQRPRPMHLLRSEVKDAVELRSRGRLTRLGKVLPGLLEELTAALHLNEERERRAAARHLTVAYDMTHTLTYRLGYPDLRAQTEDRMRWAAGMSGDPFMVALADFARVQSFKSACEYDAGLSYMKAARERLAEDVPVKGPEYTTVAGAMHLREVTLASRAENADATEQHLGHARELLKRLPSPDDVRHHCLLFGQGNVAIHEVQARLELQQLAAADKAIAAELPKTVTPARESAWHVNVARVHLAAGRREAALESLRRARKASPQVTRHRPMAREAAVLLMRQHRRATEELRSLGQWFGLDPSNPKE